VLLQEGGTSPNQELQFCQAYAEQFFENAPEGVVIADNQGRVARANREFSRMFGYGSSEVAGRGLTELIAPDDKWDESLALDRYLVSGGRFNVETVRRRKDNTRLEVAIMGFPLRVDGQQAGAFLIYRDITERRRNQEAIRQFELRRASLFQNSAQGMYRFDRNGLVSEVNPALVNMLGYTSAAEVLKLNFTQEVFLDPEEPARLTSAVQTGSWTFRETRWKRKDSKLITVRLSLTTALCPNAYEAVVEDVTPWRALEEQVRHSQKMEAVGRLAGGVAHDFNNLLTVIGGYSDLMSQSISPADPLRTPLEEIRKATDRAASLTRQLLTFSRRQVLSPRVLDLNAVIGNMENLLHRLLGEDVEIRTVLAPTLGRVRADPGQVEQVIMNLAVNARDAMPEGGRLLIESASVVIDETYVRHHTGMAPGRYVMLAVTDTGCGMSEEVRSRVFEPFFTTKPSGTGLGLSMVYGIVKQSGGQVWVYSEIGRGSTFKVYLPEVEEKTEALRVPLCDHPFYRGKETVLIVEDEEGVRTLLHTFLEQLGYTVLDTCSGAEAIIVGERHRGPIHLLLTDMILPQVTGPELAARLLAIRPAIRVLYMSGYTQDAIMQQKGLSPGAAFLEKPFTGEALAEKIRQVLAGES
jgi:PAS domain S-box-containing protein